MNHRGLPSGRARNGHAVTYGESVFELDHMSVADLLARTGELDCAIRQCYRGERLAREFHERHLNAPRLIGGRD